MFFKIMCIRVGFRPGMHKTRTEYLWVGYKLPSLEVNKLKQVGAIKEVFYLEWLANTVVVKKKKGSGLCASTSWI